MSGSGWLFPPLASPQGSEKHWGFGKASSLWLSLQFGDTTNHLWLWFPQGPWGWGLGFSIVYLVVLRGHEGHGHQLPWQRLALRDSSTRGSRLVPIRCGHALAFPLLGPLPDLGLQFRHLRSGIMISYSFFLENTYWGPLCVRQLEDKVRSIPSGSHGWEEREK